MPSMTLDKRPPDLRPRQIPGLTGIRGIAAIWVVGFHAALLIGLQPGSLTYNFFTAGWVGVDLFFLLSGFMLMHAHRLDFAELQVANIRDFAVARLMRVYPLSLVVLLLIVALIVADPSFAAHYRNSAEGNLSLVSFILTVLLATRWLPHQGSWNEPVWSLSAEIVGYVMFPVLAWIIGRITSQKLAFCSAASLIASVIILQILVGRFGQNNLGFQGALVRMAGFFTAGICLRQAAGLVRGEHASVSTSTAIGAVLAIVLLPFVPFGPGLMPVPFAALIFALFFQRDVIGRLLSSRVAMFMGKISFPLYLLHVMPLGAFHYHARNMMLSGQTYAAALLLVIVALVAASWVLHTWVERPAHQLARRAARSRRPAERLP